MTVFGWNVLNQKKYKDGLLRHIKKILFAVALMVSFSPALKSAYADEGVLKNSFVLTYGEQYELCREFEGLINHPENTNYYDITRLRKEKTMFKIPDGFNNFKYIPWKDATVEEFQEAFPDLYSRIVNNPYAKKTPLLENIRRAKVDIYHNGMVADVFKIKINDTRQGFTNSSWVGGKRFFDTDIGGYPMFYYEGRLYFLRPRPSIDGFKIVEPGVKRGHSPISRVCTFQLSNSLKGEK